MTASAIGVSLAVALLATVAGFLLATLVDRHKERQRAGDREKQVAQGVIDLIASKRAFDTREDVGELNDPEDLKLCTASVLDTRERIQRACEQIVINAAAVRALRPMATDCGAWLSYTRHHPTKYAMALVGLQGQLRRHAHDLSAAMPGLTIRNPGEAAHGDFPWLPAT